MIKELNWQSLETRRRNASLTMMYRISHNQLPSINPLNFLTLVPLGISTRSYHPLKYNLFSPRTNIYKNSFFPRITPAWNNLPVPVVTAPLSQFKSTLNLP